MRNAITYGLLALRNCPCHVELILSEPLEGVEKADEATCVRGGVTDMTGFENPR